MATKASDPNLDQNQATQPGADVTTSAPTSYSTSGSGATPASGQKSGQGTSGYTAPTSSGRFTNIQNYLNANKDYNAQGGGMAGQIGQNIQSQQQDVTNQLGAQQKDFSNKASAAAPQAYSAPIDWSNQDAAQKQWDAYNRNYTGPQGLSNTAGLQGQAQQVQQQVGQLGSQSGQYDLMRQLYGTPQYSVGQQSLDSMLLGGNQKQLQNLQQQQSYGSNALQDQIASAQGAAQQQAQQYAQQAATNKTQAATDAATAAQQLQDTLSGKLTDAQNQQNYLRDALGTDITKQNTNAAAKILGIDPSMLNSNMYGVNAADYLSKEGPTLGGVSSQSDVARAQALANIAGSSLDPSLLAQLGSVANASNVGSYKPTLNTQDLSQAVARQGQAYGAEIKPLLDKFREQQPGLTGSSDEAVLQSLLTPMGGSGPLAQSQRDLSAALKTIQSKYGQSTLPGAQTAPTSGPSFKGKTPVSQL